MQGGCYFSEQMTEILTRLVTGLRFYEDGRRWAHRGLLGCRNAPTAVTSSEECNPEPDESC